MQGRLRAWWQFDGAVAAMRPCSASLRRAIFAERRTGPLSTGQSWIGIVFVGCKRLRAFAGIEELLNGMEQARFAAAVFAPDKETTCLAKFKIINGRSRKTSGSLTARSSWIFDSRPQITRTTSKPFNAKRAAYSEWFTSELFCERLPIPIHRMTLVAPRWRGGRRTVDQACGDPQGRITRTSSHSGDAQKAGTVWLD